MDARDFYFAYEYSKGKAARLYRRRSLEFERYDFEDKRWIDAPEQACIYIGEDIMYDEITEEQVIEIINHCI